MKKPPLCLRHPLRCATIAGRAAPLLNTRNMRASPNGDYISRPRSSFITPYSTSSSSPSQYSHGQEKSADGPDPREQGRKILDEFSQLRKDYVAPRNPIILAHGLLGFSQLSLLSLPLPYTYFAGISPALSAHSIAHHTTAVPPTSSIPLRAAALAKQITSLCPGEEVNIVAHSMGGLDARYMLSHLRPEKVHVASLVTIATPHRGSAVADRFFYGLGGHKGLRRAKRFLAPLGLETDALAQLTRDYMNDEFNPYIPDVASVRYFSYGAAMDPPPGIFSPFWGPYKLLMKEEGENDGLVSVESSRWGKYEGTLVGVSHLDLINWSNSVAWAVKGMLGMERRFNAVAFYLGIADMLAKEGL